MATKPSFHVLCKNIRDNQKLGAFLIQRLHQQAQALPEGESNLESISATYIKLAQTQVKWCELELDMLREQLKTNKQDSSTQAHHTPEPISPHEWEVIAHHSQEMTKRPHQN
jgi:hypothetical protein